MKEESNWSNIMLSILEKNMGWVVVFLLGIFAIILYYRPIARYIDRTTNISVNEDGLRIEGTEQSLEMQRDEHAPPKGVETADANETNAPKNTGTWLDQTLTAFEDGELSKAKEVFGKHVQQQDDIEQTYKDKSFFLYLQFVEGNDMDAVNELELHTKKAENDELKGHALSWLSEALIHDKQFDRAIKAWKDFIAELSDPLVIARCKVELAGVYLDSDILDSAKSTLLQALKCGASDATKAKIFIMLAEVEKKLNNKQTAAYCLDKATQYQPQNLDKLFSAAHIASDSDVHDLALLNYNLLILRQPKNAGAWNNLGVEAKEAGLSIKSVQSYIRSSDLDGTLALANQGYSLLDAGFADEAEKLAKKALSMTDTHPNIYRLMSDIEAKRKAEEEKWENLLKNAIKKQQRYRKYIDKYYLGEFENIKGDWVTEESKLITIAPENGKVHLKWAKFKDKNESDIEAYFELVGEINGSTFKGKYKKANPDSYTFLGGSGSVTFKCLGYVEKNELHIFSTEMDNQTTLTFRRSAS